ncbi:MAG: hypothetical protein AAF192_19270 [Pseudomonadota bacterium]
MSISKVLAAALFSVGLSASQAHAVTTTFDFLFDGPDTSDTLTFSGGGIDLTVRGFTTPVSTGVAAATAIEQRAVGLGVVSSPDGDRVGTSGNGGANEVNESLEFSFNPSVTFISGFVVETAGGNENFDVLDSSGSVLESFTVSGDPGSTVQAFALTTPALGDTFTIKHEGGSGIFVRSITVEAIPGPLGIVGLVSAFALAAGVAARRRAAAA